MNCKIFLVDDYTKWKLIEELHECVVDAFIIFGETCVLGELHSWRKLKAVVMLRD